MIRDAYLNGNYFVSWSGNNLHKRALRIGEDLVADFPDSIDLKITNKCSYGCPFCHESSTINGESFDLEKTKRIIEQLPPYPIEIAIGGGDVLDVEPSKLKGLIEWLTARSHRTRVTLNQRDIFERKDDLDRLNSVEAVGISIDKLDFDKIDVKAGYNGLPSLRESLNLSDTGLCYVPAVIIHIIAGVFPPEDLERLCMFADCPILILGYKSWGRGKNMAFPEESINRFRDNLLPIISKIRNRNFSTYCCSKAIGFDNLAIEQLNIKEVIPPDEWDCLYMGDEGGHSMYIDAVKGEFARTSRSKERVSWDEIGLIDFFKSLR